MNDYFNVQEFRTFWYTSGVSQARGCDLKTPLTDQINGHQMMSYDSFCIRNNRKYVTF